MSRRSKTGANQAFFADEDPDYDDDGRPLTIAAAQKTYHKNNKPVYFANSKYTSIQEANEQLI